MSPNVDNRLDRLLVVAGVSRGSEDGVKVKSSSAPCALCCGGSELLIDERNLRFGLAGQVSVGSNVPLCALCYGGFFTPNRHQILCKTVDAYFVPTSVFGNVGCKTILIHVDD